MSIIIYASFGMIYDRLHFLCLAPCKVPNREFFELIIYLVAFDYVSVVNCEY